MPEHTIPHSPLIAILRRCGNFLAGRWIAHLLVGLAMIAAAATYAAFGGLLPESWATAGFARGLLVTDALVALGLGGVVASRLARTFAEQRRGAAGARLHVRMVLLFGLFAVVPTFVVAMVSGYWLSVGLQEFLSERIGRGLESGRLLGDAVLAPQRAAVFADVQQIAAALQDIGPEAVADPERAKPLLARLSATSRSVIETSIVDSQRRPIASAIGVRSGQPTIPSAEALRRAVSSASPVVEPRENGVAVILHLFTGGELFLVTVHGVDPGLWFHVDRVSKADAFVNQLEANFFDNQIKIFAIYGVIAILMLLSAVWLALLFASRMTRPIGGLIGAAERVRQGDLTARVEEQRGDDELSRLVRAFNRMTAQLDEQRRELIDANRQIDERRQLTEAVLAGVSAGVLSIDRDGAIGRANRSASELLGLANGAVEGARLAAIMPELDDALEQAQGRVDRTIQRQIDIRRNGIARTLLVRVVAQRDGEQARGFVVTFDDVSDLLSAQRMAAWADVARRIAHEIKNPLTPIQLSAERLKRKYLKQIKDDPETFTICTDTIVRQVGDIGRMVDEFSSFARMPRPSLANEDLKEICQQALFLQKSTQPQVRFVASLPDKALKVNCDRRLIGQALTNLLKNAGEAIEGRPPAADGRELPPGEIRLGLTQIGDEVAVIVEDNGKGLPREGRERLTEPYVTTRSKGTGLGLAIVKKIMEDHGGRLALADSDSGGARLSLLFSRTGVADVAVPFARSPG